MRLSKQLYQDRLRVPDNLDRVETYKLFEVAGFVEFPYSGLPSFLPLGQRLMRSTANVIREEAERAGFSEVYLPLVQHRRFLEKSGRARMFSNELMRLSGEMGSYIMAPTNEEFILSMAEYGLSSYRQLPIRMFQIADKFRNIKKPKGLLRSKQFLMCDMCSIDVSPESLQESAKLFEHAVQGAFRRFDLHYYRLEKNEGNYVDFVIPCKEGETKVDVKKDGSATYARPEDRDAQKMSSVAMYFVFPHQEDFSAVFLDKNDAQQHICLGTYGFGIQRSLHAIAEQHRDKYGINFPEDVRLFDVAIIPVDSQNENHRNKSEELYDMIMRRRKEPVLDDRINMTLRERASYADFLGVPKKVFIGDEEIRKERVTVKNRGELEGKEVDINQFLRSIGAVSLGDLFI